KDRKRKKINDIRVFLIPEAKCHTFAQLDSCIYDPSVAADVRKGHSTGSSLHRPHHRTGGARSRDPHGSHVKQKQGFHNLGYSDSTLKLEFDNNHVNQRLHSAPTLAKEQRQQASALPAGGGPYIIQPEVVSPQWVDRGQSQVPVYPSVHENQQEHGATRNGWDSSNSTSKSASPSVDETDEGVGGTPEYLCNTGDEGSVLSVDIHTSTTSLSSGGTRDELTLAKTPDFSTEESGISVSKSEEDVSVRSDEEEVQSITDSMVAEALAALEAATAGEDYE
uniref:NACHT and WD repeat domain containing 2 n=1 Tax=Nothobranchius furzeri TaxID=105023 RepID=A0A8C6K9Z0_NOTFU